MHTVHIFDVIVLHPTLHWISLYLPYINSQQYTSVGNTMHLYLYCRAFHFTQSDWATKRALDCLVFCCTCTSLQCITFYCTGHCIVSERAAQRAIPCIRGQCRESYCSHVAWHCTETWRLIPCCSKLHNTIIQSRLQCTQLEWASSSLIL